MQKLKAALGRYYNPAYVKIAYVILILVVIALAAGAPDASGWPIIRR
jgi:hypothetical protein